MPPALKQQAGNSTATDRSSCRVSLNTPTIQGSLVLVVATVRFDLEGSTGPAFVDPPGFVGARIVERRSDDVAIAIWARANSAPVTSVTVSSNHQSLQVRVLEFTGVAQANALDKVSIGTGRSSFVTTGATGTTSQADELIVAAVLNQFGSTYQYGFSGGLSQLSQTESPTSDVDVDRHRVSIHAGTTSVIGSFGLAGRLTATRDWAAVILTFRGAALGPLRMTSLDAPPMLTFGGGGDLTLFGPLTSKNQPDVLTFGGSGWIGPFEHQFLLGGRGGLLIGAGTDYRVESVEGLGGWDIRQSDTDFPRGDGAQRGTDLQSARNILFSVNFDGPPSQLEAANQALLRALRPQRDEDWQLYYRLPGLPLQFLNVRPGSLNRELNAEQLLRTKQSFLLRASDPRIYSARERQVTIPVSPSNTGPVTAVSVINSGNANAYPTIRIQGASYEVTNVQLVNVSGDVTFEVDAILPPRAELIGDMPARITGAPRSAVTIDGRPRYNGWVSPREPFFIAPDPVAPLGSNALYLRTTPPGADVTCVLSYRDTSSG